MIANESVDNRSVSKPLSPLGYTSLWRTIVIAPARHLITAEEFEAMAESGVFAEDERLELIEGEIFEMSPIGDLHAGCVNWLSNSFKDRLGSRIVVTTQNPANVTDFSRPQPDVILARPRADFYRKSSPGPQDAFLVIEVADSSLEFDRKTKIPLYAKSGIREVWLVNLVESVVEVYRDPSPRGGYRVVRRAGPAETIAPEAFPEVQMSVAEILGE
jgi:Uma2 family endonuclease